MQTKRKKLNKSWPFGQKKFLWVLAVSCHSEPFLIFQVEDLAEDASYPKFNHYKKKYHKGNIVKLLPNMFQEVYALIEKK